MATEIEAINWIKDIFIPLLSAFLGGFITLAGVWLTIRRDKKRDEYNRKLSIKPWIYSLDPIEDFNCQNIRKSVMAESHKPSYRTDFKIILKKTDNGICILDEFVTEKKRYVAVMGAILDKDTVTNLYISFEEGETLKDMYLYTKDIYGNRYKYKVYQSSSIRKGNYIEEVTE